MSKEELPYCRRCGEQVALTVPDADDPTYHLDYPYDCVSCDESLYSIETVFISKAGKHAPVNWKTLEKSMTFAEVEKFLSTRPKYRLLREEEVEGFYDYIPDEHFFIVGHKTEDGVRYPRTYKKDDKGKGNTYYPSPLFKLKVFLVTSRIELPQIKSNF